MFFIDPERCTGCGNCIEVCPMQAISIQNEKAVIDTDECAECGLCVDECPNGAIYEREVESEVERREAGTTRSKVDPEQMTGSRISQAILGRGGGMGRATGGRGLGIGRRGKGIGRGRRGRGRRF
ncbi:MAG: 4Fe-4S binding protein [Actinomycetota bacterium]|nr:4Fe-4S binding protein [Actinomycetota bacterium]